MPINKPDNSKEERGIFNNRAALTIALLLSSCSTSAQQQPPTTPDPAVKNRQHLPLDTMIVNEAPKPPLPMQIWLENVWADQFPEEYEEFSEWVATKLSKDEGLLKGIITADYKGQDLRVALVNYGDRQWQYIYDSIVMNYDLKKIFGFNVQAPKEYLESPPVDLYPTFEVPENVDEKFVRTVHRHMQMSGLLKKLQIVWESKDGVKVKKTVEDNHDTK